MFFGNAMRTSFLNMLSTHPPLVERIHRIDPKFDGKFPQTLPVEHSVSELVDLQALAAQRATGMHVHAEAVAGAQGFAGQPQAAVAQVGEPQPVHIEYVSALVKSLPPQLAAEIRDPLGAVAIIYSLLLDDDEPDVRQNQLHYLATNANPRAYQETVRLVRFVEQVDAELKLPLVSMALPALHDISAQATLCLSR